MDELERELLALRRAIIERADAEDALAEGALADASMDEADAEKFYVDASRAVREKRKRTGGPENSASQREGSAVARSGTLEAAQKQRAVRFRLRWYLVVSLCVLVLIALATWLWLMQEMV